MKLRLLLLNLLFFAFIHAVLAVIPAYIQTKDRVITFSGKKILIEKPTGGRSFQSAIFDGRRHYHLTQTSQVSFIKIFYACKKLVIKI